MKFKSIVCLLLLAVAATANGFDDEWSWGIEAKDSPADSSSLPIFEDSPVREGHSLAGDSAIMNLNIDTLPLADESETFVHEVLPLETEDESFGVRYLPLTSEDLPLDPQGTVSLSVIGEGEVVDGLVVAEDGDREGRFLGLGEKLCSFGIGINCDKKYPAPVKSHYGLPKPIPPQGNYGLPKPIAPQGIYGPPKPTAPQGVYGPPAPVKTHYVRPKPAVPQGTYGLPQSLPHPPVLPNRNFNAATPTKAPFSPLNGFLSSVLKPFIPTSKPQAPPKVSKGGVLSPSYTAPNPNYAQLLPSYTPPVKPTYVAPTPSYFSPPSVYSPPKPTYAAPRPTHPAPAVHFVHTKPAYAAPKPAYAPPKPSYDVVQPSYAAPKPAYVEPKPAYAPPKSGYDVVQPSYTAPKPAYVEPKPAYAHHVPTVTVHAQPTMVEQHHHTHTHVYNDQTVHEGIYKNDHNGVLQSVHDSINQVNQHVIQRQDFNGVSTPHDASKGFVQVTRVSTHGGSQGFVQVAQPSVNHVVQQQLPAKAPPTPSIVPAVLVGGTNFRPGKIESGFQPSQSVLEPIFRPQQPSYREDCHCVVAAFCSDQDVIARNFPADISNVIDARTRGSNILSNATDSEEDTTDFPNDLEEVTSQSSARQGKMLALFDESLTDSQEVTEEITEEATEETTESATEAWTEYADETTEIPADVLAIDENKSRVRRDANATVEETEDPDVIYSDRQGRQLTGFTPGSGGCGPQHVCCRRPVYEPRRQQYTCGRRNAAGLLGRVKTAHFVQGDTEFGEYPWQAAILKRENGDILYQCGGTLIDDKHVLTAAHCVDGIHPTQLKIRLGEWDVSGQTEFYDHVEMRAAGVYLHPEFYAGNLNNDIAVIRLENFVDLSSNPHITPVCLPDQLTDFTHHRCHATGWGKDAFGTSGKFSHVLKAVEIPVMERQHCQHSLQSTRLGSSFTLHEGNLCAGGEEGKDTCKGDGGGPLVCSGPDGSIQLVGLVSWGIGCGHSGVPGVYVKVAHYLDWIRDITRV